MLSGFVSDLLTNRRGALKSFAGLAAGTATAATTTSAHAATRPVNLNDPKDNLYAFGKIWAGYDEPVIGGFHGLMYARTGNSRMIPVFGYAGTGVLQAQYEPEGFLRIKSRETGYFTDLRTGEVLETWKNPFTEETVEVYHFYNPLLGGRLGTQMPRFQMGPGNDPPTLMNEGSVFPGPDGKIPFQIPYDEFGDDLMVSWDYTHDHINPVPPEGWPKSSTGPRITPSEHFTFTVSRKQLEDADAKTCRMVAGFSRQSPWWPWMKMGGHKYADGILFGRMSSHKGLKGTADVHPKILKYIEKHAPEYLTLPKDWPITNARVDTWSAYAQDTPPENPSYEWKQKRKPEIPAPPSGSGRVKG
jgi:Protein of unknown function (DUF1838)